MNSWIEYSAAIEELYSQIVAPIFKKYELTFMEFTVLMFLTNNPQYNTAAEIVKYRHLTKSHVSMSVHALKQRNLLVCKHQGKDRRSIHLYVSKEADSIIQEGLIAQNNFKNILHDGFSQEEIAMMSEFIQRIDQNISIYTQKLKEK